MPPRAKAAIPVEGDRFCSKMFTLIGCILFTLGIPGFAQLRSFTVKFIASDVIYIDGGSAAGLREGTRLTIKRPEAGQSPLMAPPIANLVVISVASTSAACEIVNAETPIQPGDAAFVDPKDLASVSAASLEAPTYAQVVEFRDDDPLEAELRENLPKPPLPEVNRLGGRIGFEEDGTFDHSPAHLNSQQQNVTFRFDFTRIGNTYWSLDGYWRARLNSTNSADPNQQSFNDLLQRVYHFGLRYDSPESRYVAGFGRLLVPWASSLSTLDGGYFGRKIGQPATVGVFAGSTPDPTAWNYDPNRQIGGIFVNFETGSFDRAKYSSTTGIAISRLHWRPDRQFLFAENGVLIGPKLSFHHNVEVDYQSAGQFASTQRVSLSRSFLTARVQPFRRVSFDINHNYFRILPTADPRLAATGLLDNILFQGLTGGTRVEGPYGLTFYGTTGRSKRSEDQTASWNRIGGVTARIPKTGLRADVRYSQFTGTIATGRYRSVSVRRESSQRWRFEIEGGDQRFDSLLGSRSNSWFATSTVDVFFGRFVAVLSATGYRGGDQNYDQFRTGLDYRF
jgi:hypothetical protein